MGKRRLGATQCIDKDECEKPGLCENGATCINLSDSRHFRCSCAPGWAGKFCREPAPAGNILYGGRDFIIVFVFCILSLLGNFLFPSFCRRACCFVFLFSINPSSWMLVSLLEIFNCQSQTIHQSFFAVLVLVFVVYNRRREAQIKYPGPDDDVRENIINYEDEGGGEDDMTAFDITPLQVKTLPFSKH